MAFLALTLAATPPMFMVGSWFPLFLFKESFMSCYQSGEELPSVFTDVRKSGILSWIKKYAKPATFCRKEQNHLDETVCNLEETVSDLEETVSDLEETVSNLEETVSDLEETVSNLEETISDLEGTVSDKERQIVDLEKMVSDRDKQITKQKAGK